MAAELTAEGLNLVGVRRVLDLEDRNRALLRQLAGGEITLR